MSSAIRKNTETGAAYRAAARHFGWMAELFVSTKPKRPPYLSARKMAATLKALKRAPPNELAAINAVLAAIETALNEVPAPDGSNVDP